jgi:hypothetical protein
LFAQHLYNGATQVEQRVKFLAWQEFVVEKTSQLIQALLSGATSETIDSNSILPNARAVSFTGTLTSDIRPGVVKNVGSDV